MMPEGDWCKNGQVCSGTALHYIDANSEIWDKEFIASSVWV